MVGLAARYSGLSRLANPSVTVLRAADLAPMLGVGPRGDSAGRPAFRTGLLGHRGEAVSHHIACACERSAVSLPSSTWSAV